MNIPLQTPPDLGSIMPSDLSQQGPPTPSASGLSLNDLGPEQGAAIPDEGKATIHYKVHHRRSEEHHNRDGSKRSRYHVHMHVTKFEPHGKGNENGEEEKKPKKKLSESKDAQEAARDYLTSGVGGG
jgi:hypothetical protein